MDSLHDSLPAPIRPDIAALPTSGILAVFKRGLGRPGLIPLWVGEGDRPTPDFIGDAASAALKAGHTYYTYKRGIPELRQALSTYETGLHGQPIGVERISLTSSGMTGLVTVLQTLVAPGDNVIVVSPIWPNIVSAIQIASGVVRNVTLQPRDDGSFQLDLNQLEAAIDGRTRAIFCASPGNPTGWVATSDEQRAIVELCRRKRIWLLADEVYVRFTYVPGQAHAPSYLDFITADDPVIVINSFSKAWAMTGWRLGWLVHPPGLGETLDNVTEFTTSGAPHFLQYGCIAALEQGEAFAVDSVERCRQSGEIVYQALASLPRIRLARPAGAFYAFFGVEGLTDSLALCLEILEKTGVGLAPGSAFGPGGEGHIRLCFAASPARLAEAMERLRPVLR